MPLTPTITTLGLDPSQRAHILNGNAFQQDAILSFAGWQYVVFYSPKPESPAHKVVYVNLARRKLPDGVWEQMIFEDYEQTADDGHNTVQMGICPGDGTIHLSYDHHCGGLKYRHSVKDLTRYPTVFAWDAKLFSATFDHLPGILRSDAPFACLTYPRFGFLGSDMFFSARDGQAGLGDDFLCIYRAATGSYEYVGKHLKGVKNNPYVHGLHWQSGKLHVTWVYRDFVYYEGWDTPNTSAHQHAGPNGPGNNYNIYYAYSEDSGQTWKNGKDETVANLKKGESILPHSLGIMAFEIPKASGLANQESQAVDCEGGVHVLNRQLVDGELVWTTFYRSPSGKGVSQQNFVNGKFAVPPGSWTKSKICPAPSSTRGCLATSREGDIYILLPEPATRTLKLFKSPKESDFLHFAEIWAGEGFLGEPLVDRQRLENDNVLSVFTLRVGVELSLERNVVVLDFVL
ncbi:hypothetical protein BJY01DRAFT_21036 [Aspergillus pseudoustus]|uniref:ASST-domain-containing protein n=1 Tax=Aspergillus pseudoustus TaxID=1810923 RepID=A0ABR4JJQ1_9EURO